MKPCKACALVVLAVCPLLGATEGTLELARAIRIPEFKADTELAVDVLARMHQEIRRQDPAKGGVNLLLAGDVPPEAKLAPIAMHARNVSAEELIRQFCQVAELHCTFGDTVVTIGGKAAQETAPAPKRDGEVAMGTAHERARAIRIPQLRLEDSTLAEACDTLRKLAVEHDPAKQGINLVLQITTPAGKARAAQSTVDLQLNRISLDQAIRYVCLATGLHCRFDPNAVIISDTPLPSSKLETRTFEVAPGAATPRHTLRGPKKIDWND